MGGEALIILGIAVWLMLLATFGWALWICLRAPFRALGVLVAGMAVHNILLMALVRLGTPTLMIRSIQIWKELLLLFLLALAGQRAVRAVRQRHFPALVSLDFVVAAFALAIGLYALMPRFIFPSEGTFKQILVSFRSLALLPLLYVFGRLFWYQRREDLIWVAKAILGSAIVVGLFGLVELWFIPTIDWVNFGAIRFSEWLGYTYHGPSGLPENFFQSTGSGLALRRMVSTYLSPLGIAYTGLLIVPMAFAILVVRRQGGLPAWFRWSAAVLVLAGILFSVTRGALVSLVGEVVLLGVLLPQRRIRVGGLVTIVVTLLILFEYQHIGPIVRYDLSEIRAPAGLSVLRNLKRDAFGSRRPGPGVAGAPAAVGSGNLVTRTITLQDPSAKGHVAALRAGIAYLRKHPLGTGLGSAVPRYGTSAGPTESALLTIGGELGVFGAALYLALYSLVIVYGALAYRRYGDDRLVAGFALIPLVGGLALVPIMLTSNVWGDFSVTFLFWWAAGSAATLVSRPKLQAVPDELKVDPDRLPISAVSSLQAERG